MPRLRSVFRSARLFLGLAALILVGCGDNVSDGGKDEALPLSPPTLTPGDSIETTVTTVARGGTYTSRSPDGASEGTMSLDRRRVILTEAVAGGEAPGAGRRLTLVEDKTESTLNTSEGIQNQTKESPITGLPLNATRETGRWVLSLAGGRPTTEQQLEIDQLEAFENRRWLPGAPVAPGDSWQFEPVYFRKLIEQDLGMASARGTMTLQSIDSDENGATLATIGLSISTLGAERSDMQTLEREAEFNARGSLVIDLDTMLERRIVIEGVLKSSVGDGDSRAVVTLPIRIEIRREMVSRKDAE